MQISFGESHAKKEQIRFLPAILLIATALSLLWLTTLSSCQNKVQYPAGKPLGPALGGRITGIVVDPQDPDKLIVCSPGGGVWRTVNNGKNWTDLWQKLDDPNVYEIAWDKTNPNRLLAATPSTLFYLDSAFEKDPVWKVLAGGYALGQVPDIDQPYLHENGNAFLQVGIGNNQFLTLWARQGGDLYYSFDGSTFSSHNFRGKTAPDLEAYINTIGVDASNRILISTTNDLRNATQVWQSEKPWTYNQPSLNWRANTNPLPYGLRVIDFEFVGNTRAAYMFAQEGSKRNLWVHDFSNNSWKKSGTDLPNYSWAPTFLKTLGGQNLLAGTVSLYQTPDTGATWQEKVYPDQHADMRGMTLQRYTSIGKTYVWVTSDGFHLDDFDQAKGNIMRWELSNTGQIVNPTEVPTLGLIFWQAYNVLPMHRGSNPERFLTGSLDNGALCIDLGGGWTKYGAPNGSGCADVYAIVAAPSDPNRVYVRSCSNQLLVSDNARSAAACKDVQWRLLSDSTFQVGPPWYWTNGSISVKPSDKDFVCLSSANHIATSTDGGKNWRYNTLPNNARPIAVHVTDTVIYAGSIDQGLFLSRDKGLNWTAAGLQNPAPKFISNIAVSNYKNGSIYAATSSGLYQRAGSGAWTLISGNNDPVFDVAINPVCQNFVFAAFGKQVNINQKGAIQVSNNHGSTWRTLYDNGSPVTDLHITEDSSKLSMGIATFGRGVQAMPLTTDCNQP